MPNFCSATAAMAAASAAANLPQNAATAAQLMLLNGLQPFINNPSSFLNGAGSSLANSPNPLAAVAAAAAAAAAANGPNSLAASFAGLPGPPGAAPPPLSTGSSGRTGSPVQQTGGQSSPING